MQDINTLVLHVYFNFVFSVSYFTMYDYYFQFYFVFPKVMTLTFIRIRYTFPAI